MVNNLGLSPQKPEFLSMELSLQIFINFSNSLPRYILFLPLSLESAERFDERCFEHRPEPPQSLPLLANVLNSPSLNSRTDLFQLLRKREQVNLDGDNSTLVVQFFAESIMRKLRKRWIVADYFFKPRFGNLFFAVPKQIAQLHGDKV